MEKTEVNSVRRFTEFMRQGLTVSSLVRKVSKVSPCSARSFSKALARSGYNTHWPALRR